MSADVRHSAEDDEPELRAPGKAPVKKPLAEFLAEFEERLARHPDEPATTALQVVEDRAAGVRRSAVESSSTRHPKAGAAFSEPAATAATPAPEADSRLEVAPHVATGSEAAGAAAPDGEAPTAEATPTAPPTSDAAAVPGESRRLRGRHRRKHRHRAH